MYSMNYTTLCIQFFDRENNILPLGKEICFTIVWAVRKFFRHFLRLRTKNRQLKDLPQADLSRSPEIFLLSVRTKSITENFVCWKLGSLFFSLYCIVLTHFFFLSRSANALYDCRSLYFHSFIKLNVLVNKGLFFSMMSQVKHSEVVFNDSSNKITTQPVSNLIKMFTFSYFWVIANKDASILLEDVPRPISSAFGNSFCHHCTSTLPLYRHILWNIFSLSSKGWLCFMRFMRGLNPQLPKVFYDQSWNRNSLWKQKLPDLKPGN